MLLLSNVFSRSAIRLLAVAATVVAMAAFAAPASAVPLVAITDGTPPLVVTFDSATPGTLDSVRPIRGLPAGEELFGIDQRPANDLFYVLTIDATDVGRIYTLDLTTTMLTLVSTLAADPADLSFPYTSIDNAGGVGIDFNPVPDRLRITTQGNKHMRVNVDTGLVTTDLDITGESSLIAMAYTNSFPGAITTTLFGYSWADKLAIVNPPNNGTSTAVGPTSGFVVMSAKFVGMDIPRGSTSGLVSTSVIGVYKLFAMDLTTGAGTLLGNIGDGTIHVSDITAHGNGVAMSEPLVVRDENSTAGVVTVRRSGPYGASVVNWTATAGTATASDWAGGTSGTVAFEDGAATATLPISIVNDAVDENAESFVVDIAVGTSPVGAVPWIMGNTRTTVTIADDESPVVAAPADTVRPLLLLASATSTRITSFLKVGFVVPYSTSEAGTGTATLRVGTKTIGTVSIKPTGATVAAARIKASLAGRRYLAASKARVLRGVITVQLRDAAGNLATSKRAVLLVR